MENKHPRPMLQLLNPILNMCPEKTEIEMLESIHPDVELLLLKSLDMFKNIKIKECIQTIDVVIDLTWEELNTGHWSLVPNFQRRIYAAASLIKVVALVQEAMQESADCTFSSLDKAVKSADLGLLLGNSYRNQLTKAAQLLSETINKYKPSASKPVSELTADNSSHIPKLEVATEAVPELHCPSIETFSSQHFYPRTPVKITGCMSHWPALERWTRLDYLVEKAGSRTVPVELGSSYSDSNWSQRLMPLREFVTQHITQRSGEGTGYLAQHQLFDQVPELRQDIAVPEYCACSEAENDEEGDVDTNAWFGPSGTVSPLHFDPKHNLLCQVVGRKRVTLYAPSCSDSLYPHEGRLLSNTARVDPEAPDYRVFPKYRDTQAFMCLLNPGEMLYIPPTWWHHVRSLDISFSVSFWWL